MGKTVAERVREFRIRKRAEARRLGTCTVCFKAAPNPDRTICAGCRSATDLRKRHRRKAQRVAAQRANLLSTLERAGDAARAFRLYAEATQHYQEALRISDLAIADRGRLTEKVAHTLILEGDDTSAIRWFDQLFTLYRSSPYDAKHSIESILQVFPTLVIERETSFGSSSIWRTISSLELGNDDRFIQLLKFRKAVGLHQLDRFDESAAVLEDAGYIADFNDPLVHGYFLEAEALVVGVRGNAEKAYDNFNAAIALAKANSSPHYLLNIWSNYAQIAENLGDIARAKACYEEALFVAQCYRLSHEIAVFQLFYAKLLSSTGRFASAVSFLNEALSTESANEYYEMLGAWIGIPLALELDDQKTLARCSSPHLLAAAEGILTPSIIGKVTSGFANAFAARDQLPVAQALIHRALEKIKTPFLNLDLLLATGKLGDGSDVAIARQLLEQRTTFPHPAVFQAGLALFDAFTAERRGASHEAHAKATDAVERFADLGLHGYAKTAQSILSPTEVPSSERRSDKVAFSHMQSYLTSREREVAALVLRGYSNASIASELTITLHTVEKHMKSIMRRLGVRSRYQVADFLQPAS